MFCLIAIKSLYFVSGATIAMHEICLIQASGKMSYRDRTSRNLEVMCAVSSDRGSDRSTRANKPRPTFIFFDHDSSSMASRSLILLLLVATLLALSMMISSDRFNRYPCCNQHSHERLKPHDCRHVLNGHGVHGCGFGVERPRYGWPGDRRIDRFRRP